MTDGSTTQRSSFWGRWLRSRPVEPTVAPAPAGAGAAFRSLFDAETSIPPSPVPQTPTRPAAPPPQPAPPQTPPAPARPQVATRISPAAFLSPTDLRAGEMEPPHALAIGSCLLQVLLVPNRDKLQTVTFDFLLVNDVRKFPESPPADIASYHYQIVQIPLRGVMHDRTFSRLDYADLPAHQIAFEEACGRLELHLRTRMKWNIAHGKPTFVMNFVTPQFNQVGRFAPKYDLRNIEYFVAMLNQELERLVLAYQNAYILDIDRITTSLGKRFLQDDTITGFNHGSYLSGSFGLKNRIEDSGVVGHYHEVTPLPVFSEALSAELDAMYRTMLQTSSVKLVVVDLDDTLWNGVVADMEDPGADLLEGWAFGIVEALQCVRRRGILLAIISKNDEAGIRAIWKTIFAGRLLLEDFCAVRINWRPKPENMAEILQAVSLLPRNVVFIDDNPAERARMQEVFPDMRVLGRHPLTIRRVLLQAPETQTVTITPESANRTAMVQGQIQREEARAQLSLEAFVRDQNVRIKLITIRASTHAKFARAFELINKTNQFNTTGARWTAEACGRFLQAGGFFAAYEVEDRYTPYGLVGVVLVQANSLVQWVMSCRILGMGAEQAVMHTLVGILRGAGAGRITAPLIPTKVNQPCHSLYAEAGFTADGETWTLEDQTTPQKPPYLEIEVTEK